MSKKRIFTQVALLLIVLIVVTGCNLFKDTYKTGDTVRMDNIDLTVTRVEFAKYLSKGTSKNPFLPPSGKGLLSSYKKAEKGHTYLSFSVKIKNTSKEKISLENVFNDNNVIVEYNGTKYYTSSVKNEEKEKCKKNCYKFGYAAWKNKKNKWIFKGFSHIDLELVPNETIKELRVYINIPTNVRTSRDKGYLILKTNNKEKQYVYKIN